MSTPRICWVDGRLHSIETAVLRADDSAFGQGLGCYSTARVSNGSARFAARHAARLARDAAALGLGRVEPEVVLRALSETARAAFPASEGPAEGVVRIEASRDGDGVLHLSAVPRALGPEPDGWRVGTAPFPHAGPMPWRGAKVTNHLLFALAARDAGARGFDDVLLFDRDGYLIEGSRTSIVVIGPDARPALPDLARGGVAGIAREVLLERVPGLVVRNIPLGEVRAAVELVAINAVRGARACLEFDGARIGSGAPGPFAARLDACLARGDDRDGAPTRPAPASRAS